MSLKAAVSERFGELRAVRWRENADSPAEFAGSIEPRDRFSEGVEDARLGIAPRSAVRRRAPRIDGYAIIRWLIDRNERTGQPAEFVLSGCAEIGRAHV